MALLLSMTAGCAHWYEDERAEAEGDPLYAWLGEHDETLVMRWGAPDAAYALENGERILTWRRSRTEREGGESYTVEEKRRIDGKEVMVPVTHQEPVRIVRYHCTTNIKLDRDGYVIAYDREGNDCDFHPPAPPE